MRISSEEDRLRISAVRRSSLAGEWRRREKMALMKGPMLVDPEFGISVVVFRLRKVRVFEMQG